MEQRLCQESLVSRRMCVGSSLRADVINLRLANSLVAGEEPRFPSP